MHFPILLLLNPKHSHASSTFSQSTSTLSSTGSGNRHGFSRKTNFKLINLTLLYLWSYPIWQVDLIFLSRAFLSITKVRDPLPSGLACTTRTNFHPKNLPTQQAKSAQTILKTKSSKVSPNVFYLIFFPQKAKSDISASTSFNFSPPSQQYIEGSW